MKYSPSLPQKNDNISHNNPVKEFLLLCSGLALLFVSAYWILGFFVDIVADKISYETEVVIFQSVSRHFDFEMEENSEEQQRVQSLVNKLQTCVELPYSIRVHMVQAEEPNAIALPGGNIAVFSELLNTIDSENGLAFVLAHELGHFKNRDHLRNLGRSLLFITLTSMITGGDSFISSIILPSSTLGQAHYSRAREKLADHLALDTLDCYYGHVGGASEFFTHLQESHKDTDNPVSHYFSTHPQLQDRISDIKLYAESQGYDLLEKRSK